MTHQLKLSLQGGLLIFESLKSLFQSFNFYYINVILVVVNRRHKGRNESFLALSRGELQKIWFLFFDEKIFLIAKIVNSTKGHFRGNDRHNTSDSKMARKWGYYNTFIRTIF